MGALTCCLVYVFLENILQLAAEPLIFLESTKLNYLNETFASGEVSMGKVANGLMALNISLHVERDIPDDVLFSFKIFKLDEESNIYEEAYDFNNTLCSILDLEYKIIFGEFLEDGFLKNFLKGCPVTKGHYYFINGQVPNANFPWLPIWKLKTTARVYTSTYNILDLDTYAYIEEGDMADLQ